MNNKARPAVVLGLILVVMLLFSSSTSIALYSSSVAVNSVGSISILHPLHVETRYVKNDQGQIVHLRGANFARFIDTPNGDWVLPDGSIDWNHYSSTHAIENLDAMHSWGINVVRVMSTVEWWTTNTGNHRQNIKDFIALAAARNIYVVYGFWRTTGTSQPTDPNIPYPPYNSGGANSVIKSTGDFVNLWASVASELKNYPNALFELWNEPTGDSTVEASWFNVAQQCITSIRQTGSTNLVVIQWGYAVGIDFAGFAYFNSSGRLGSIWSLDWISQNPLVDPTNNILYSTHIYRSSFYDSSQGYIPIGSPSWANYTSNDLNWALDVTGVLSANKPVWVGEIGPNQWATDANYEFQWYNSALSILNRNGVDYCAWWWWPTGNAWTHLSGQPNYAPSQAGSILRDRINNGIF